MIRLTKKALRAIIAEAYSLGGDDRANQEGYNIAVRIGLVDPRLTRRPRNLSKNEVAERAAEKGGVVL